MTLDAILGFVRRFTVPLILIMCAVSVLLSVRACNGRQARQDAAQAKIDAGMATARSEAGKDAVGTVSHAGDREAAIDATSRGNNHDIRTAPGAAVPVDPAVAAAGRRSLCKRAVYRDSERCKRLLQPNP